MEFGPVFNKEFLLAVYDLQQQILQVRTISIIKQFITNFNYHAHLDAGLKQLIDKKIH